MPGCEALKSSATLRSTWTCSGASPVPRQQYQRIMTSPGFACDSFAGSGVGGGGLADSDEAADPDGCSEATAVDDDGAADDVDWLHAANSSASTARRTANRPAPTLMTGLPSCSSFLRCPVHPLAPPIRTVASIAVDRIGRSTSRSTKYLERSPRTNVRPNSSRAPSASNAMPSIRSAGAPRRCSRRRASRARRSTGSRASRARTTWVP